MSSYIRVADGGPFYPYAPDQLRGDHPDTSFPADIPDERLADWGVYPVAPLAAPDTAAGEVAEEAAPALIDGVWTQQWAIRARTGDEFEQVKAAAWAQAKIRRDQAVDGGCAVAGVGTFDSDPLSRSNINGAVTGALIAQMAAQPFAVNWKLADNVIVSLDATEMIAAGMAVMAHVAACHANAQAIGTAIATAADFAALDAIDIGAGWP